MWGAFWLFWACICELREVSVTLFARLTPLVFAGGILIGLAAFKQDWEQQRVAADKFLGGTP